MQLFEAGSLPSTPHIWVGSRSTRGSFPLQHGFQMIRGVGARRLSSSHRKRRGMGEQERGFVPRVVLWNRGIVWHIA
jgi:hypothetical protein